MSAETVPVKVDGHVRRGQRGRKELSLPSRGLSSFVSKMMHETAAPIDAAENTTERVI